MQQNDHVLIRSLSLTVVSHSFFLLAAICLVGCGNKRETNDSSKQPRSTRNSSTADLDEGLPTSEAVTAADASSSPRPSRQDLIDRALDFQEKDRHQDASKILRGLLLENPNDHEVIFHLANLKADQGRLDEAIELLGEIPADHPQAGIPALGVSADWCFQSARYEDAEQRYRKILQMIPSNNMARRQLAYLLNRQGRRYEAVELIQQLCQSGDVTQDELSALIVQADAMYDPPGSQPASSARPYWPIGEMGEARFLFTEKQYRRAAEVIQPIVQSGQASPAAVALFGRAAVEAQDDNKLAIWRSRINEDVKTFPDYWAAIGTYLIREGKYRPAVRALAEAIRLDPSDIRSMRRLFKGLRSLDRSEEADIWIQRYATMNRIVRQSNAIEESKAPSDEMYQTLADELDTVGRMLEAIIWRAISAAKNAHSQDRRAELNRQRKKMVAEGTAFPNRDQVWCGMDFGSQPLPPFPDQIQSLADNSKPASRRLVTPRGAPPAMFRDVSRQVGLNHRYRIGRQPLEKGFAMYQTYGGGVAVCDFDRDGWPDIYLTQGAADPDGFIAAESDRFYRTTATSQSGSLQDITVSAGVAEKDYTLGVTAGDWNQDGFPDLALANIGVNRLLINQGDGTFRIQSLDQRPDFAKLSTSMAMGDVTGDHLPDLFVLNYLRDPEIAKRPELDANGDPVDAVSPLSVKPSRDELYINAGDGDAHEAGFVGADLSSACTGLGVILTDLLLDHQGNEVFVANDVKNNQLWVRDGNGGLADVATAYGCAYGSLGAATAAMGIAAGDLDRTGSIDLHVTNFINEPVSMYAGSDGLFRDLNYRFDLTHASIPVLGFGTQAIDYSNDGWLDLVVTNGHVEDLRSKGQPFRQPAQLFANLGARFELVDLPASEYWAKPHLGRALARLDFDRNGKTDFIVTDLFESAALLLNESPTSNHWVTLHLVGTASERDAIGAKIVVRAGDQSWSEWVVAGDGYLCKNEPAVHVGIGAETNIDRIEVSWPSGQSQILEAVPIDRSVLIIEGEQAPHLFSKR